MKNILLMRIHVVAHKPNILNVIYTNPPSDPFRVQLSSLRFVSEYGAKQTKPNISQSFKQRDTFRKHEKKHSTVNDYFKLFLHVYLHFFNFVYLSEVLSTRL